MTGLIAHSLYGPTRKPTAEMLRGVDALVFDMQDIGCRGYTYVCMMALHGSGGGESYSLCRSRSAESARRKPNRRSVG